MRNRKYILTLMVSLLVLTGCTNDGDMESQKSTSSSNEINIDNITIVEHEDSGTVDEAKHISIEEAAHIGIEYISKYFDFDFEGTYIQLQHFTYPKDINPNQQSIWRGAVFFSEQLDDDTQAFGFLINPETGNLISFGRTNMGSGDALARALLLEGNFEEIDKQFPQPEEDEINRLLEAAKTYVEKHFAFYTASRIEYFMHTNNRITFKLEIENDTFDIIYISIHRETETLSGLEFFSFFQ